MSLLGALLAGVGLLSPWSLYSPHGSAELIPGRRTSRGKGRNKSPRRFSGVRAARRAARKARRAA